MCFLGFQTILANPSKPQRQLPFLIFILDFFNYKHHKFLS
ncbi:hypothetical protein SPAR33_0663 [Streptococcus pneumoniae GA13723]|nr:hypothetical protein SPAR33_0663 [Streptococcus pneumoniae GA13723]